MAKGALRQPDQTCIKIRMTKASVRSTIPTNNSDFHEVMIRNMGRQFSTIWITYGEITADTFQELHSKTLATTGCGLLPTCRGEIRRAPAQPVL